MDFILSEESAKEQLDNLVDFYDIDFEELATEDDGERAAETITKRLLKAIRKGLIEIVETDDGGIEVVQQLKRPVRSIKDNRVTYKEVSGRAKTAMGKYKEKDHASRMYAFLGALSGTDPGTIMSFRGVDMRTAETLGAFFIMA